MQVRRFKKEDAAAVSNIVRRGFLEVNIKDYPIEQMQALAASRDEQKMISIAENGHMYVVCDNEIIVGTGTISTSEEDESILNNIFVLPECHGRGIGALIMRTLEKDEIFLSTSRTVLNASITAYAFYEKMGYTHIGGQKALNEYNCYVMEKFR